MYMKTVNSLGLRKISLVTKQQQIETCELYLSNLGTDLALGP